MYQGSNVPRFKGVCPLTPELKASLDGYSGLHERLAERLTELKKLTTQKDSGEAQRAWKQTKTQ